MKDCARVPCFIQDTGAMAGELRERIALQAAGMVECPGDDHVVVGIDDDRLDAAIERRIPICVEGAIGVQAREVASRHSVDPREIAAEDEPAVGLARDRNHGSGAADRNVGKREPDRNPTRQCRKASIR